MVNRPSAVLAVTVLALSLYAPPVEAATASSLYDIGIREDHFYNYDFNGEVASAGNVDWAISLVFYNNAEIDKVKNALNPYLPYSNNGEKDAVVNDGGGYRYDGDRGRKVSPCPPTGWFQHYRVYADGDDRLYNLDYGYWIIGSTHFDYNDGCSGAQHGYSETAEDWVAYWSGLVWPGRVFGDYGYLYNYEGYRVETSEGRPHIWENNGYATYVSVP